MDDIKNGDACPQCGEIVGDSNVIFAGKAHNALHNRRECLMANRAVPCVGCETIIANDETIYTSGYGAFHSLDCERRFIEKSRDGNDEL